MLNFVEMIEHSCHRLGGIVLVVGLAVVSATAIAGEERSHPSLVDPAITKCTVCHKDVGSTHPASASGQACLSCHRFEAREKKTFLIVEGSPRSQQTDDAPIAVVTVVGGVEPDEDDSPNSSDGATARSDPPPAATIDEIAPVRPSPTAVAVPETSASEREDPVVVSGSEDSASRLYAGGRVAFRKGEFDNAFQTWRSMLADKLDHYVVQVEVDTYLETAQSTMAEYENHSLYVLKKDELYWVFSGFYPTMALAAEALTSLPEPLRRGGAFPVSVRQILPKQ